MNCANCGAGLQPVGGRDYFRCPYCETFHFPTPTTDGVADLGGGTPFACPVCADPLTTAAIHGHDVSYCRTCRGFLCPNDTFGRIVRERRARPSPPARPPVPFDAGELRRKAACPRCRGRMDTHPYHAGGNAVIDTCARCHLVWLDAGELTVLGRYRPRERPAPVPEPAPPAEPEVNVFGFPLRLF
ncbi:MAG TPA: zf-TFIIB domain-containing protein [Gemmataceae bacterium]|jgi:Zn-finger nucleic acid-binding protein|nr:zf-TFIIB domain-containing protein [Gemmataceae bacterium]